MRIVFKISILPLAVALSAFVSYAQVTASGAPANSPVPFVGCKSDGQTGPVDAPDGPGPSVDASGAEAHQLAYYKAEDGFGVLGPRGWYCFGTYGSNGSSLYVSPTHISGAEMFSDNWKGFTGPAIQISTMNGGTSGRFQVAKVIARVFKAHMDFVDRVIAEGIEPASNFSRGPFPGDKLVYRSKEVVEFVTGANTDGLGTQSRLLKNGDPISGVAILLGEEPNLVQLSVRLPANLQNLASAIVKQVEQEAEAPGNSK